MAEARSEEEEENMRDTREQVVRRQPRTSGGRPGRRKPEHRLSQGPLSSIRAVIKRTSTRPTSVSETSRERDRERDRDRRRPEITILSAEPLTSVSWFPGASGGFPPPPPPAAQIWGSTIPPAIQPPPSYEEVIREKTQEQVLLPPSLPPPSSSFSSSSSSSCSSSSSSRPTSTITIATQTDTGSAPAPGDDGVQLRRPVRPPRPSFPSPPTSSHTDDITTSLSALASVSGDADLFSRLTPSTCSHTERSLAPHTAAGLGRPRPRPRSKLNLQPVSGGEVQVQTLVKLRDDGLATLAARAVADPATRGGVSQGKYLQELLEAFSSDDWGFPECHSGSSGQSESEEEEEEDGEDMAALKERIQAFEQQVANESCGDADGKDAVTKRPEPRPRPRLQGQQAKSAPPTVAPKPKNFPQAPKPSSKVFWEDAGSAEAEPQLVRTAEKPTLAPKPQSPTETLLPSVSAPLPAPRPPPPKLTHSLSEVSSSSTTNPRLPPRPAVAPRGNLDKSSPTLPPRPSVEVSSRAKAEPPADETQATANQTVREGSVRLSVATKSAAVTSPRRASAPTLAPKPTGAPSQTSPDPNPLPAKPAGPMTLKPAAPAPAKPPAPAQRKNPVISVKAESSSADPPLPPRPSSVKLLPLRPPPIKSIPERPPPPAVTSTSTSAPPPSVASPAPGVSPASQGSPSQTPPHPTSVTANQQQRVPKKGPPLPPRPKPGHPLYSSYTKQEVLIVLDDPSPAPPEDQTPASPVTSLSQCLLAMDTQPEPGVHQDCEGKPSLDLNLDLSQSQSILPVQPPEQKEQPDAAPVSGPRCVALFDYEGEEEDELTFSQGDVIALLELMGQEWGRGQIHGRVGIFPLNFTEVTEPPPPPQSVTSPEETTKTALDTTVTETSSALKTPQDLQTEEWEVALFDFPGQAVDDLSFHKGALILVTERVDAEWRRGRLEGREGLYPAAFTQPCQARPITEQQQTAGVAAKGAAKALFDFVAESEDEIMLKVGDIITEVEAVNEQWIVGVVGGRRGIVPKNYVSLL